MKNLIIVGNWKLNFNRSKIVSFLDQLNSFMLKEKFNSNLTISISPPTIYLEVVNNILRKLNSTITLTSQNIDLNISGSFTGETSVAMLKDMNYIKYVIVGHSERRIYHNETNSCVAKKFKLVKDFNLIPILCIGETKKEKDLNQTKDICRSQIDSIIKLLGNHAFRRSIIAYEPIWAIGSGISADPNHIQKIHCFIRNYIKIYDSTVHKKLSILYGGSVNYESSKELLQKPDVNGALIGNSSLKCEVFLDILKFSKIIIY